MSKLRTFFETFNLALGMLLALLIGAVGALLLYLAFSLSDMVWVGVIGLVLVVVAAVMLYRRVTILHVLDFFASGSSWN
ncbi:MAG: hypothetical protein AAGK71_02790 [Pseudomonadota bacterium]